jgi:retron-type reverse transcriptase
MGELKPPGKPFDISKQEVQDAWEKVKANKGAPGADGVALAEFEADLKNNLYKEHYSKPHVIEKKKSPRAASNASR